MRRAIQLLNKVLDRTKSFKVGILLENSSGEETLLGASFDQLARMRRQINNKQRLGFCLSTAHLFAAGYDFRNSATYQQTLRTLANQIGVKHVHAFHLSDSESDLNSRIRSQSLIGKGKIGFEGLKQLLNDKQFLKVPMIVEPQKDSSNQEEAQALAQLRALAGDDSTEQ